MTSSPLYSILALKCPRCRKGDFLEANPYNLTSFNKVKSHCPKCQLKYSIEPSFYTGSMYVSYGLGVALAVAVYVSSVLLNLQLSIFQHFISIVVVLVLAMPYLGAVSKAIWAHFFFKFDKEIARQV